MLNDLPRSSDDSTLYKLRLRSTPPPERIRGRLFYRACTPESPSPPPRIKPSKPASGNMNAILVASKSEGVHDSTELQEERTGTRDHMVEDSTSVADHSQRLGAYGPQVDNDRDITDIIESCWPASEMDVDECSKEGPAEAALPVPQDDLSMELEYPAFTPGPLADDGTEVVVLRRGTRTRRASRRVLENSMSSPVQIQAPPTAYSTVTAASPVDYRRRWLASHRDFRAAKGTIQALRLEIHRLEISERRLKNKLLNEKERLKDTKVEVDESRAALVRVEEELDEAKESKKAIRRDLSRYRSWWIAENHSLKAILTLVPKRKRDAGLEAIVESSESRFMAHAMNRS